MFESDIETTESDRVTIYRIKSAGDVLNYANVLKLWRDNSDFRSFFTKLLADSPYSAYRWETPAITRNTVTRNFEFVLLDSPGFCARTTDDKTYDGYFTTDDNDLGIVAFPNIRGDATLVVPSPRTDNTAYGHLAAFIRNAPKPQINAFWRVIAETVTNQLDDNPIWLSTAGGGVAWLHVRLDSRPKYYGFSQYKTA